MGGSIEIFHSISIHFGMPKNHPKKKSGNAQTSAHSTQNDNLSPQADRAKTPEDKTKYIVPPGNIIVEQNQEMLRQDEQLVDLEASIVNLRDASLTINQEVSLHNILLEDVHTRVDQVQGRQVGTQDRLRGFMRRSGTCKLYSIIALLGFILLLLLVVLK